MSIKQNFFIHTTGASDKPSMAQKSGAFIDVGGTGDCGFRAIAAGLIDLYSRPALTAGRDALLQTLFTRFDVLFPTHAHQTSVLTPMQRLQQLQKRKPYHQLIVEMGHTLRQIAVDELCANPEHYPGAFVGEHEGTTPAMMRKTSTWVDESSLAALSNTLHLPITVNVVDGAKSLPHQFHYRVDSNSPSILIQLEKGHYVPFLRGPIPPTRPNWVQCITPAKDDLAFDRDLPDILARIADDQKRMKDKFESIRHQLETQVLLGSKQGGLNQQDLLDIYVNGMQTSDYLGLRACFSGLESGRTDWLDAIKRRVVGCHDEYLVKELVHAIARAISIGHMSPDVIYKDNQGAVGARLCAPSG